ncbi:FAD-dependent oxidoreductase [Zhongshania sp.]|uniref:FAD-dependent oxidoreductase n=1 Tax=Zhongshania sp. TaxID=1971902 RepID=UPI00356ACD45
MADFDEVVDFAIVGSGGGAMCAALQMAAKNKRVVMLEKSHLVGGTTARAGGVMWIPNNRFLKRDGIDDSFELAAKYFDGLAAEAGDTPGSTPERRHTYLRQAPKMVDFLLEQGIKLNRVSYWPDYYDERPGGLEVGRCVVADLFDLNELGPWREKLRPGFLTMPATLEEALLLPNFKRAWRSTKVLLKVIARTIYAKVARKQFVSAGAALQGRMLQAVLRRGVDVRSESPVSELIVDDGVVRGVLTVKNGKPWRISARLGVLVAAGGFAHNQRMRDKYQPGTSTKWTSAAPTDTGEMIEEMMRHGAAIAQMDEMVGNQCTLPPGSQEGEIQSPAQSLTAKPHAILVDQTGQRYMNEGGSYMAYCKSMLARNKAVPAVPSWAVFDSQYMKKYMLAGTMPGSKKPQSWYDEGYLKQAQSVADLAEQLGMSAAQLEATVNRFNGFVRNNYDEDFQRGERAYDNWLGDFCHQPSQTLGELSKPPFYAVQVVPGDVGTYGGVVTDTSARVLREDGSVIPGLYATGVSTASVMGRVYPGAGSSIGPTFVWGFVAANHAAGSN